MSGILQNMLTKRYGLPEVVRSATSLKYKWNVNDKSQASVLYMGQIWDEYNTTRLGIYRELYGDAKGGFLVGDSLKIATLSDEKLFGLYFIDELKKQPEVIRAKSIDPDIHFFMDASNIWFYGFKDGKLYVYDSETMELDVLGSLETELEVLISEWEEASDAP